MSPALLSLPGNVPDVRALEQKGEVARLIDLLRHPNSTVQSKAAAALGRLPAEKTAGRLIDALDHPDRRMRIAVVEVLSDLRDGRAVKKLLFLLSDDESNEVRWASAIALGEVGDEASRPGLVAALTDPDKYVRYGVALALEKNGWAPADPEGKVFFLSAAQRWDEIPALPLSPVAPLIHHLRDYDPAVRAHAVAVLGELHDPEGKAACDLALRDLDGSVRWEALKAFPRCNIPLMHLPRGLSRRKREKDPKGALILNFLFIGLGYTYLGFWWGFLLFQICFTTLLILLLFLPVYVPFVLWFSISPFFVIHTWLYMRGVPDL